LLLKREADQQSPRKFESSNTFVPEMTGKVSYTPEDLDILPAKTIWGESRVKNYTRGKNWGGVGIRNRFERGGTRLVKTIRGWLGEV
jgi:hypothetical protein